MVLVSNSESNDGVGTVLLRLEAFREMMNGVRSMAAVICAAVGVARETVSV